MPFEVACMKFCMLQQEYTSSAVNVLKNSPKISDLTKTGFFQLYFSHIRGETD